MAIRIGTTREGSPLVNKFKVWEVTENNGFIKVSCSTGRKKNKDSDEWINSYWNLGFVGNCKEAAKGLQKGDVIVATEFQVEHTKAKDDKYYTNITVFAFTVEGQKPQQQKLSDDGFDFGSGGGGGFFPVEGEDDLPF